MDLDAPALRLLQYIAARVSATIADNQDRIARALELSSSGLAEAMEELCGRGLIHRERWEGSAFVLRITDKGIAFLQEHKGCLPPVRKPWRKVWDALAAAVVRAGVALRHAWQDRRQRPPSSQGGRP